ncbi:MAG: hypothetical protein FWG58_02835 [Methanomassiliicoccaceae archaeon]|nr:hypothetical protein [Methanomassiliicoccaceae archaeon]
MESCEGHLITDEEDCRTVAISVSEEMAATVSVIEAIWDLIPADAGSTKEELS